MAKGDPWKEICDRYAAPDGLPVRKCGRWTEEKLWFWHRYVSITTTAMVGKPHWAGGVVYIDLFSGPGVCQIEDTGKRLPGSPLIAANARKPFTKIVLCELADAEARACETRMQGTPAADRFVILNGDCNLLGDQIAAAIPDNALTLAFVDPEGLDFDFELLRRLSADRQLDLLILFADAIDAVRNADQMLGESESRLDRLFGAGSGWRGHWPTIRDLPGERKRERLRRILQDQIVSQLGYADTRSEVIKGPQGPLYSLIYASKHKRGLEFWDKSAAKELSGQDRLW